jgi:hypothetical protein
VLVAVRHHGAAPVPPAPPDDVHRRREERIGAAHDRPDVEVVLPVLDRDVERVPPCIQVGHDRIHAPVAVAVDHVARVTVLEKLGVESGVGRGLPLPRADADAHAHILHRG